MTSFVIDSCAIAALLLEDEAPPEELLSILSAGPQLVVPHIWSYEIANIFATAALRDRLPNDYEARMMNALSRFDIHIIADRSLTYIFELSSFAIRAGLSAYDASYLSLAISRNASLLTLDAKLSDVASNQGVIVPLAQFV